MAEIRIDVRLDGPILHGQGPAAVESMMAELRGAVRDQASADVHRNANQSFKHPTPYYETQIHSLQRGRTAVVNDRGVVYGPWLEGAGSRNRTTRFKGYHLWRKATTSATKAIPRLAKPILAKFYRAVG